MPRRLIHKYSSTKLLIFTCIISLVVALTMTYFIMILLEIPSLKEGLIIAAVCSISIPVPISYYILKILYMLDQSESELNTKNSELEKALSEVKTLQGLIPVCSNCKKIRNDEGYWGTLESYIHEHSDAMITHGICEDCTEELYGPFLRQMKENKTSVND